MSEVSLLKHQLEFLQSTKPITVLLAGRGAGKSFVAAYKTIQLLAQGFNVLVFAQTYKALTQVLMKEIENRLREHEIPFEFNKGTMQISLENGATVFGYSSESPDSVRGLTNVKALIIDEAALAPKAVFDIASACLRGQGAPETYLISTPRGTANWLSILIEEKAKSTAVIHATTHQNIFLDEAFVALLESQYSDSFYEQEILGKITGFELENQFFPTLLLNEALSKVVNGDELGKVCVFGIDVARFGQDSTVISVRRGHKLLTQVDLQKANSFEIAKEVEKLSKFYRPKWICFDGTGGFAGGSVDVLREKGFKNVVEVNFSAHGDKDTANRRAFMYDQALNWFKEGGSIQGFGELQVELLAQEYFINSRQKKQLVPKSTIKQKLGKSPDLADSFVLTFAMGIESEDTCIQKISFNKIVSMGGYTNE